MAQTPNKAPQTNGEILAAILTQVTNLGERVTTMERKQQPLYDYFDRMMEKAEKWKARREKMIQATLSKVGVMIAVGVFGFASTLYNGWFGELMANIAGIEQTTEAKPDKVFTDDDGCRNEVRGNKTRRTCPSGNH